MWNVDLFMIWTLKNLTLLLRAQENLKPNFLGFANVLMVNSLFKNKNSKNGIPKNMLHLNIHLYTHS